MKAIRKNQSYFFVNKSRYVLEDDNQFTKDTISEYILRHMKNWKGIDNCLQSYLKRFSK